MPTKEVDTLIQTKDAEGNQSIHYPITLGANVLISDELAAALELAADPTVNAALTALLAALGNVSGGGVSSFNGRTGAVMPQSGDYSKSAVGLGNVPNVATNDQTPTYTEASTAASLTSGEKLSVAFGKIAKAITDFLAHVANKSNPHGVTASQVGAAASSHNHAASNITSGTLGVARGGTGATTFTSGAALVGAGTGVVTTRTIRNNTATSGAVTADTALITSNTLRYAVNRTTSVAAADTGYTTYMARGIALVTAATNPSVNGAMTFTYK